MVKTSIISAFRSTIEMYLIEKNNFVLDGSCYDLILVEPSSLNDKYSILISAKLLDRERPLSLMNDILSFFKKHSPNFYHNIARVNVVNSSTTLVKNLKFVFSHQQDNDIELRNYSIGGITIDYAFLLKTTSLKKMVKGRAVNLFLNDGNFFPAGLIKIDKHFKVYYYTAKGLREIFPNNTPLSEEQINTSKFLQKQSEHVKIQSGLIGVIDYSQIDKIE